MKRDRPILASLLSAVVALLQAAHAAQTQSPTLPPGGRPLPDLSVRVIQVALDTELTTQLDKLSGPRVDGNGNPVPDVVSLAFVAKKNLVIADLDSFADSLDRAKAQPDASKGVHLANLFNGAQVVNDAFINMNTAQVYADSDAERTYKQRMANAAEARKNRDNVSAKQWEDLAASGNYGIYLHRKDVFLSTISLYPELGIYKDTAGPGGTFFFQALLQVGVWYNQPTPQQATALLNIYHDYLTLGAQQSRERSSELSLMTEYSGLMDLAGPEFSATDIKLYTAGLMLPRFGEYAYALEGWTNGYAMTKAYGDLWKDTMINIASASTILVSGGLAPMLGKVATVWVGTGAGAVTVTVTSAIGTTGAAVVSTIAAAEEAKTLYTNYQAFQNAVKSAPVAGVGTLLDADQAFRASVLDTARAVTMAIIDIRPLGATADELFGISRPPTELITFELRAARSAGVDSKVIAEIEAEFKAAQIDGNWNKASALRDELNLQVDRIKGFNEAIASRSPTDPFDPPSRPTGRVGVPTTAGAAGTPSPSFGPTSSQLLDGEIARARVAGIPEDLLARTRSVANRAIAAGNAERAEKIIGILSDARQKNITGQALIDFGSMLEELDGQIGTAKETVEQRRAGDALYPIPPPPTSLGTPSPNSAPPSVASGATITDDLLGATVARAQKEFGSIQGARWMPYRGGFVVAPGDKGSPPWAVVGERLMFEGQPVLRFTVFQQVPGQNVLVKKEALNGTLMTTRGTFNDYTIPGGPGGTPIPSELLPAPPAPGAAVSGSFNFTTLMYSPVSAPTTLESAPGLNELDYFYVFNTLGAASADSAPSYIQDDDWFVRPQLTPTKPPATATGRTVVYVYVSQTFTTTGEGGPLNLVIPATNTASPQPFLDWPIHPGGPFDDTPVDVDLDAWAQPAPQSATAKPLDLKLFFTSLGKSTGSAFELIAVNSGGRPVRLRGAGFVLRPAPEKTRQHLLSELQKLRGQSSVTLTLDAYCLNMQKPVPQRDAIYMLADRAMQDAHAAERRILLAARRVRNVGGLHPDSDVQEYFHFVRQWAVWTREQRFTQSTFTTALVQHTRKNVEAGGDRWRREYETEIRELAPNRWSDIQRVLSEADRLARR